MVNVVGPPVTTVSATLRVPLVAPTIVEPIARDVHRFAKRDSDVRVVRHLRRAVGRRGGGDSRRGVHREAENKVRRHVVRRIDAILIGHLSRDDRDRAGFASGEISIRIDSECRWTTSHNRGCDVARSAGRTRNLEPVACYVDRFAESDSDVRICRLIVAPLVGVVAVTVGATSTVVKLKTKFAAMLSGGSPLS